MLLCGIVIAAVIGNGQPYGRQEKIVSDPYRRFQCFSCSQNRKFNSTYRLCNINLQKLVLNILNQ